MEKLTSNSTEFHADGCKLRSPVPNIMHLHLVFMIDVKATTRRKTACKKYNRRKEKW